MGDTGISWTHRPGTRGRTWNPTKGCSRTIAEGAEQSGCGDGTGGGCYAEVQAGRIVRMSKGKPCAYDGLVRLTAKGYRWTGKVTLSPEVLRQPLSWRQPSTVFVNSMSDLFHEKLSNEQIAAVFAVMAATPRHTYQILTKRADRMRDWFEWFQEEIEEHRDGTDDHDEIANMLAGAAQTDLGDGSCEDEERQFWRIHDLIGERKPWPLPNVWLGVSVENQAAADERIPELLRTPAAVRFLSCEPLLGEVDVRRYMWPTHWHWDGRFKTPEAALATGAYAERKRQALVSASAVFVDWIIAGCESGPGARPCSVEWLRSLRDQCAASSVPFFLKQAKLDTTSQPQLEDEYPITCGSGAKVKPGGVIELPYLDGVQWAQFPEEPARG